MGGEPGELNRGGCKQKHVVADALLVAIEGMHTSTDEIGSALCQIGFHAAEIEHNGVLLTHGENRIQCILEMLRRENEYVVPTVGR